MRHARTRHDALANRRGVPWGVRKGDVVLVQPKPCRVARMIEPVHKVSRVDVIRALMERQGE